jgi:hypothetical protein
MAAGMYAQPQVCSVNVYIMTGVAMPAGMILDARLQAAAMFREIGVNVHISQGAPVRDLSDACGAPIVVQLEATTRYPVPFDALAYALPYRESGTCIHVFLDRVSLGRTQTLANALLAHVIVHEITHVLEQVKRHSEEGVMKARWSSEDYQRMERHPLSFAPGDVDLIAKGIVKRISHVARE